MVSIRNKILAFAVIATLVPSLGLGYLSFKQSSELISDNVTRELRLLVSHADHELDMFVQDRINAVRLISSSGLVTDGLTVVSSSAGASKSDTHPLQHLKQYLDSVQVKLDAILELSVVNASGQIMVSSANTPAAVVLPADWSERMLAGEYLNVVPPHWDASRSTATFSIAVPVYSSEEMLVGLVVAVIDLGSVQSRLKSVTHSPLGEVILLDATGRVLLLGSHTAKAKNSGLSRAVLEGLRTRPGEIQEFAGFTHDKVVGLSEMSGLHESMVVVERNYEDVYGTWAQLRNLFLTLVGALVLIVGIIAWRIGRSIVLPLNRLVQAAGQIADGDLEVRLGVTHQQDELGRLTGVFNQMTERLRRNQAEILFANQAMQQQNRLLETLSVTDGLTGLYNRSKLDAILSDQLARFKRNHRPFVLLMMDIDHFKTQINDHHGHVVGDEVLTAVAGVLAQSIRNVDSAARYGGDEFIIILTDTAIEDAMKTAERIRSQVENLHHSANRQTVRVTLSIGIIESRPGDMLITDVLARADKALYEAKHAGRNRVLYS